MPNSLKAKLSNLRYKGQITDAEYKELISKLNGHDRQILDEIRAEVIEKAKCTMNDTRAEGLYMALQIIDKYREEHET